MHKLTLVREMAQRPRTSVKEQIDYIVGVALRGNRGTAQGWDVSKADNQEYQKGGKWVFVSTLYFEKTGGRASDPDVVSRQWDKIMEMVSKAGSSTKFNKYPWLIRDEADDPASKTAALEREAASTVGATNNQPTGVKKERLAPGVTSVVVPDRILTVKDLRSTFPHDLLQPAAVSDRLIEEHPAFQGIYNRGPQIRTALSAIWTFIESEGEKASHVLLYGLPACAKTGIFLGIERLFGPGCALKLDSTSTSRAGLERLIFKELTVVPPFVFMEEIEKANEEALRMWLGAMDDRREFRKVMHHMTVVRQVNFLGFATANDKPKLDMMMGGRANDPGALSSRFQHQLECPRPDETTMRRILMRDLPKIRGREEWVGPCIDLAQQLKTDDPRRVLAFLDGRERLLNGEYQRDILSIYRQRAG